MQNNEERIRELAECIYDLDAEVYAVLGSSLGRVFSRNREKSVREIVALLSTRPDGHFIRSEIALIGNMARTIPDKEERKLVMTEYNRILNEVMSLPTSMGHGDVLDPHLVELNTFNLKDRFSENSHLIICISWTYGSGGIDVGFKLADKLKINYYDAEIFQAVLKRLEVEKDAQMKDHIGYTQAIEEAKDSTSDFIPAKKLTIREHIREFSRYHGLPKQDAIFFNQSDLLCEMAQKEDFIIMGRCGDAIITNNEIPHISIYISAPFDQRVQRTMEVNGIDEKKAIKLLHKLDKEHAHYYHFYTGREWGNANNYDICLNTASYGIDGAVDFIWKMLGKDE